MLGIVRVNVSERRALSEGGRRYVEASVLVFLMTVLRHALALAVC